MKKFAVLFILLLLIISGCDQKDDQATEDKNPPVTNGEQNHNEHQNNDGNNNEQNNGTNNEADDENDGNGEDKLDEEPNNEDPLKELENRDFSTYVNNSFQDINISVNENELIVTGKARVFEGVFQYAFISNNEVVKGSNYQTDGAPAWGEFELTIDKSLLKNDSYLELFYYSPKDGAKTDVLTIPLH